ncbi:hypothetical protein ACJIZ3_013432 [Penstemon smallii]|uniref:Pectinesterase inhibitor domain-containing protein n=1 Tax=Penstemon smallii TaxID=265156 RepID=A0ABD3UR44_9LAMI
MKFSVILATILQLHGIMITQFQDQSLIETTCKNTPNYELCFSTLTANPLSATADVEGLGLIMVDSVKAKAETVLSLINELDDTQFMIKGALQQCTLSYRAVLKADVPEAVAGLTKGVPKFAEFGMTDAAWEAEICEGSFGKAAVPVSPLSEVNKEMHDLAKIAVAIIRNLL